MEEARAFCQRKVKLIRYLIHVGRNSGGRGKHGSMFGNFTVNDFSCIE